MTIRALRSIVASIDPSLFNQRNLSTFDRPCTCPSSCPANLPRSGVRGVGSKSGSWPHQRIDYFSDARKSTRDTEFSMRGHVPSIQTPACSGLVAGLDGVRMSSVLFTAKTMSKATAKTV
jgi:hypothetical protein